MTHDIAIEFKNVFEKYDIEILLEGKSTRESFEALQDISFSIRKGESVAIIGPNGAGKSTILRLIAGLLRPEKGEVRVNGRVGSLLDLGAGFHPELTGRDNLLLNASLYNFSREELDSKYDQILAFADIGKFINAPVRCYSQGMYVRLAFSLAIHVDPDILLIDDCLAVGDDNFRAKSLDKALELKAKNKTIVFVTHDFVLARQMCERGIFVRESKVVVDTDMDTAIAHYLKPLEVDKERYKYLGAKLEEADKRKEEEDSRRKEEEERRNLERMVWQHEEEKRRQLEQSTWQREVEEQRRQELAMWQRGEEERRRLEIKAWEENIKEHQRQEETRQQAEDDRRKANEEKRLAEIARRKQSYVLSKEPSLKIAVAPGKVQIFHHEKEMTTQHGLHAIFSVNGVDHCSCGAVWKIYRISETQLTCFVKWRKPNFVFQIWNLKLLDHGEIDLEIIMRLKKNQAIENERTEVYLLGESRILDEDLFGKKSKVFCCGKGDALRVETFGNDQVCEAPVVGRGVSSPYFLTVPENGRNEGKTQKSVYFRGRISSGSKTSATSEPILIEHSLGIKETEIVFKEGSCQLFLKKMPLTLGFGIYTSIFGRGYWYDSKQAKWKICASSADALTAEGFWPWIPIAQIWRIALQSEKILSLEIQMKVLSDVPVVMQETVLMLQEEYREWGTGKRKEPFPEGFTKDDFFRFCFWAHPADGKTSLSAYSNHLPSVTFEPSFMPDHRIILENSAHINNVKSRLFHCLKVHKKEEMRLKPGTYDFFKGLIHIKEEFR
jgi:ABC-type polysaccharide/polyol phosphate transport system ATPase subunit